MLSPAIVLSRNLKLALMLWLNISAFKYARSNLSSKAAMPATIKTEIVNIVGMSSRRRVFCLVDIFFLLSSLWIFQMFHHEGKYSCFSIRMGLYPCFSTARWHSSISFNSFEGVPSFSNACLTVRWSPISFVFASFPTVAQSDLRLHQSMFSIPRDHHLLHLHYLILVQMFSYLQFLQWFLLLVAQQ